jgi:hypothetical protein
LTTDLNTTMQSYLDFLQVKWRESPASDPVGAAKAAQSLELGKR